MVTYHRHNDFTNCIESVLKNTIVNYHLHIIDNSRGAIDNVLARYETLKKITVYKNDQNIGKPKAVNSYYDQIMRECCLPYFISIDSDVIVKKAWLLELISSYQAINVKAGLIAPVIQNKISETWVWQLNNQVRMHNISELGSEVCPGVFTNRYTAGPAIIINKSLFESVGRFDEGQMYGADDGILCRKFTNRGYFVGINTNVSVIHSNLDSDQDYLDWKARNVSGDVDMTGRWG